MKKLLTVLALLLIALSLFAAGAKEEAKSSEKIELTFWSPFTGGDGEFFDAMIEAFKLKILEDDEVDLLLFHTKSNAAVEYLHFDNSSIKRFLSMLGLVFCIYFNNSDNLSITPPRSMF